MKITLYDKEYDESDFPLLIQQKKQEELPEWEAAFFSFLEEWILPEDSITAYSSGSTGEPKKMLLRKEQMIASARMTNSFFNLKANDRLLLCLSAGYIAGKMMIVRALVGNFHLWVQAPSSCPVVTSSVDMAAMVPMQVQTMVETCAGVEALNRIHQLIIGGSAISSSLELRLQALTTSCYATYGMTETVSHIALRAINGPDKSPNYKAVDGVSFEQDDRQCLVIRAPHLQAEPFVTNDIVQLHNEHSFEWLGRNDHVINSGGVKLFPERIEAKIHDLLFSRYFITSVADEKLGERVVLVIEGDKMPEIELEELKNSLKERLNRYELPREILFLAVFRETGSGKIKRELFQ